MMRSTPARLSTLLLSPSSQPSAPCKPRTSATRHDGLQRRTARRWILRQMSTENSRADVSSPAQCLFLARVWTATLVSCAGRRAAGAPRPHARCNPSGQRSFEESALQDSRDREPGPGAPPQTLVAFYWHFIRQTKRWYAGMFVASLCVALLDTVIPLILGRLVALMATTDRAAAIAAEFTDAPRVGRPRAHRGGRSRS